MPSFKKNLLADCLIDDGSVDDQYCLQAVQVAVTCGGFETRVNNLLDDRIDLQSDPALQVHAAGCLSCRQTLGQYEQLALVLGSARGDVEHRSDTDLGSVGQRPSKRWQFSAKIAAPMTSVALLAVLVFIGQYFNDGTNVDAVSSVAVVTVKPQASLPEMESSEFVDASQRVLTLIEEVSWPQQGPVGQLLVDSGSELLAAGREQAAVIQSLSEVRLDLDLDLVEARLAALQPVLNYSGRIPALSPMQGTVCFTLGWLRKGKVADEPKLHPSPDAGAELGMQALALRDLA